MKLIPLTQGKFAMVDDADYDFLIKWKWHASKAGNTFYARRTVREGGKCRKEHMARVIMGITNNGILVDHKDHNGLNNQKGNLRQCTPLENARNKSPRAGKYLGVDVRKWKNKDGNVSVRFRARVKVNGKDLWLGTFYKTAIEAAHAYDNGAIKHYGEFANLNFKAA
jgi:hypothetical protein